MDIDSRITGDMAVSTVRPSRRQTLREFQQQLVERTQRAGEQRKNELLRLALHVGDQRLLIDVADATEVIPFEGVTPVPHTRDWFLGLINCRGKLNGVIDFAGFLGQPVAPVRDSDRLLVLSDALPAPCALRISRVAGLVSLSGLSSQPRPSDEPVWVTGLYVDREAVCWRMTDLAQLMLVPAFLDVIGTSTT